MSELGPDGPAEHAALGELAQALGIELISVAEPAYGATGDLLVADPEAAVAAVRARGLGPRDVVLVKASRSAGLERVVRGLRGE